MTGPRRLKRIEDLRVSRVALVGGDQANGALGIGVNDRVRLRDDDVEGTVRALSLAGWQVRVVCDDGTDIWVAPATLDVIEKGEL